MKTKSSILVALMGALLFAGAGSPTQKLDFEKAVLLEEASGKIEEAISLYKKVATSTTDEALAAQAQLRVGMCYEKLGKQEARKAYQLVLDRFPTQKEAVVLARERLARMDAGRQVARTTTVREFLRSGAWSEDKISDPTIGSTQFVVTGDGNTFVYTDWMTGDLVVKNFATGKSQALYGVNWYQFTEFYEGPVLSPDDTKIAYVQYAWPNAEAITRLQIDSIQGGSRETLYEDKNKQTLYPLDWSPDGKHILAALEGADRSVALVTVGVKDKKVTRLTTLHWENLARNAQYSPDGRYIAYDSTKHGERKIYLLSSDAMQERVLIDSTGEDDFPLWSRDGRFLLFRSNRSGDWDLMGLAIKDGQAVGEPFVIKSNIGETTTLRSVTADGRLFYDEQVAGQDVAIMERGNPGSLRDMPKIASRGNISLSFLPDSKRVAFLAGGFRRLGRHALRIVNIEDNRLIKDVSSLPADLVFGYQGGVFSPDGSQIIIQARDRRSRRPKLVVFSTETTEVLRVLPSSFQGGTARLLGWSKDGRQIFHSSENFFHTVDIETGEIVSSLSLPKGTFYNMHLSPDRKYLATVQPLKEDWFIRSLEDGTEKTLPGASLSKPICWHPDSKYLLARARSAPDEIHRVSVETGQRELFMKLALPKGYIFDSISPDGKYFGFRKETEDIRIWVVENFLPKDTNQIAAR